MEIIKDHVFGDPLYQTIEIVLFKASQTVSEENQNKRHQLHQTKVLISIEKGVEFDFDFSDEISPFGIPYVYFMHQNFIKIVSPITSKYNKII